MKIKIVNQLRLKIAPKLISNVLTFKLVFWKNKHDDPVFSLHLMIADILDFIPSKSRAKFSVAKVFMRISRRN